MKDFIEIFFRLIVGKSRVAYRKDVIRRLEGLKCYYENRGKDVSGFDEEIARQYTKLAQLEEGQMKRK